MAKHYVADGEGVRVYEGPTPRVAREKALRSVGWGHLGKATVIIQPEQKQQRP